jgi:hypothetical protein
MLSPLSCFDDRQLIAACCKNFPVVRDTQESDPLHDPDYREAFLHVDGSITEKVLMMLQEHSPVSAGVRPPRFCLTLCLSTSITGSFRKGDLLACCPAIAIFYCFYVSLC